MHHDREAQVCTARVLLVEDDRRLLAGLATRLTGMGCACTALSNASEALIQFAAHKFDLVITDLTMPGVDGLSVLAIIRSQSLVPILVITGHSSEYRRVIDAYPNVTVMEKPVETLMLTACVSYLISQSTGPQAESKCG